MNKETKTSSLPTAHGRARKLVINHKKNNILIENMQICILNRFTKRMEKRIKFLMLMKHFDIEIQTKNIPIKINHEALWMILKLEKLKV